MLACAVPPPAPASDEDRLLAERARMIALLRQVDELREPADGLREWLVAQIRRIDEHIREARRQQNTPPPE